MTIENEQNIDRRDQWAANYMAREERRNALIGFGVLAFAAIVTLGILYHFGNLAATGW